MLSRWKTYGLGFVFWTAVGLLFSGQQYLLQGPEVTWPEILRDHMLMWYLWGLSSPCLAWLDRHLPYRAPRAYRLISRVGSLAGLIGSLSGDPAGCENRSQSECG